MVETLWGAYVRRLLKDSGKRESEFLADKAVQQGTFNRWKNGHSTPTNAADVAEFAVDCDRNPLEAFVAASMLSEAQAGRGLSAKDRMFLRSLSDETPSLGAVASEGEIEESGENH